MAKVKFDVSGTDPSENAGKIFEDPVPGVYKAKVQACNHGFSKGDDGKPDRTRPRLEVVYEVTDAKDGGKYRGSRVWDYVVFTEASQWRLDQFLMAMGISNTKKRKGEFDTDDLVNMPVKIRIKAETGTSVAAGDYRPRIATIMMGDDADAEEYADGEVEELDPDAVADDVELEDETEEVEEVAADSDGYTEDALSELKITELGSILTDEFEVDRADVPKGKDPKIAMILDLQATADGEGEQAEADAEDAEEDLEALAELVDEGDDEDGKAEERLTELAEENDLDPNEYPTWAELAEAITEAAGGEGTNQEAELKAMSIADLRAKAKELEIDSTGAKSALIARILEFLGEDPF